METARVTLLDVPDDRVTFDGLTVVVSPVAETELDRVTLPLNPFRLVSVTVELADELAWIKSDEGCGDAE